MTETPPTPPTPTEADVDVTPLAPGPSEDDAFVASLLASLPRLTMPDDVVARVDAALAALAHAPGASGTAGDHAAGDHAAANAATAAAAASRIGSGADGSVAGAPHDPSTPAGAPHDPSTPAGAPHDPSTPAGASATPLAPRPGPSLPAPRRGRTALAALAGVAAVVVAASLATTAGLQSASAPVAGDAAGAGSPRPASVPTSPEGQLSAGFDGPLRVLMSGTAYESERLLSQVTRTLSRAGSAVLGLRTAGPADRSGSPAESTSRLAGCIHTLTGTDQDPAVVDLASYEGRPATVLVIRDVRAGAGTVWVVGRDCDDDTASLMTVRRITWPAVEETGTATGENTGGGTAMPAPDAPDTPDATVSGSAAGSGGTGGSANPASAGTDQPTTAPAAGTGTTPPATAEPVGTAPTGPDTPVSSSAG